MTIDVFCKVTLSFQVGMLLVSPATVEVCLFVCLCVGVFLFLCLFNRSVRSDSRMGHDAIARITRIIQSILYEIRESRKRSIEGYKRGR